MGPPVTTRCIIDPKPIRDFQTMIVQDLHSRGGSIGTVILDKWPKTYFEFLRKRYRVNAAGGGDWAPLSPKTKPVSEGRKGIQRVTDTIYDALLPDHPGNYIKEINNGVRCGIAGGNKHPNSRLEIARIAAILSKTGKNRPARPIVVVPDASTIKAMQIAADRGFAAFIRKFNATDRGNVAQSFGVNVPRVRDGPHG